MKQHDKKSIRKKKADTHQKRDREKIVHSLRKSK